MNPHTLFAPTALRLFFTPPLTVILNSFFAGMHIDLNFWILISNLFVGYALSCFLSNRAGEKKLSRMLFPTRASLSIFALLIIFMFTFAREEEVFSGEEPGPVFQPILGISEYLYCQEGILGPVFDFLGALADSLDPVYATSYHLSLFPQNPLYLVPWLSPFCVWYIFVSILVPVIAKFRKFF